MAFRLAYFGLPLGAITLLAQGFELGSCALPPISAPGARRLRRRTGLALFEARRLGAALEPQIGAALERERPDLLVSWFWTRKLPRAWLAAARLGGIGVHPSLLPRHRGRDPYFWAIDAGDAETGVSVHRLEPEYDTGEVLLQERLDVGGRNAWQLARALDGPSLRALCRVVRQFSKGSPPRGKPQDERRATLAPAPSVAELAADFRWPSARVLRRIRALSPVPGLALELGGVSFFVTAARPATAFVPALEPGEAEWRDGLLLLRTGDGAIAVERGAIVADDDMLHAASGEELGALIRERLESQDGV